MKYIITENDGMEFIFIFPQFMEHREFVARLGVNPIRAGFVYLCDGKLVCMGESDSLYLQSNPEKDTRLLNRYINFDFQPGV